MKYLVYLFALIFLSIQLQTVAADTGWQKIKNKDTARITLKHPKPKPAFPKLPTFKDHKLTVFATAPEVNCPVSVIAEPTGAVLALCDRNAGLGLDPDRGVVYRLIDENDDGKADYMTKYIANVDTPRGGHFLDGVLYMVHPPYISAYRDIDGDGVADEKKMLGKGFGHDLSWRRGGDHTTNDLRIGIDGWIYIAIGDFGVDATGSDGTKVKMMHGGVIRMRRDGSDMHIYARGTRNTYDIAIDYRLDILALDNTNDGDGWDMRLHHITPLAHMGYPELYKFFSDDAMHPLFVFGGGSGVGALYLEEPGFPKWMNNRFHNISWGKLYTHELTPNEATFISKSTLTLNMNKLVDLDVDGSSRLYFSNFENGGARVSKTAVVGRIVQAKPNGWQYKAFPDLKKASVSQLIANLNKGSSVLRRHSQMALIKHQNASVTKALIKAAKDTSNSHAARIAALYTLNLRNDAGATDAIKSLLTDKQLVEFAIRALLDRKDFKSLNLASIIKTSLDHEDPRVRMHAIVGAQKLALVDCTDKLLALSINDPRPTLENGVPHVHNVVPHTARRALIAMAPLKQLHAALSKPSLRSASLAVCRQIHSKANVQGLMTSLKQSVSSKNHTETVELITVLLRLYKKEHDWHSKDWWGTRPNSSGPYFKGVTWHESPAIAKALQNAVKSLDEASQKNVLFEVRRHSLSIEELNLPLAIDPLEQLVEQPSHTFTQQDDLLSIVTNKSKPQAMRIKAFQAALDVTGFQYGNWCVANLNALARIEKEKTLYTKLSQDYINSPSHRASIINRVVKIANKIRKMKPAQQMVYYESLCVLAQSPLTSEKMRKDVVNGVKRFVPLNKLFIDSMVKHKATAFMPLLKTAAKDKKLKPLATAAISSLEVNDKQLVGSMPLAQMKKLVMKTSGDPELGKQLFMRQSCVACHTVSKDQPLKGPYLGSIGNLYNREQLITHVADPAADVAQGFLAHWFKLKDGQTIEGFVASRDEKVIRIRNIVGMQQIVKTADVAEEGVRQGSMMPAGLVNALTIKEFASLIDYLQSMH